MFLAQADGSDLPATRGGAAVAERRVAVVALFLASVDEAVSAGRSIARSRTVVTRARVAVVTLFGPFHDAVSADGLFARAQALVCIRLIAVIAFFVLGLDEAVSAVSDGTRRRTFVGVVVISVVAFLLSLVEETVSADCFDAGRQTSVAIVRVSVVALLTGFDAAVAARAVETFAIDAGTFAMGHDGVRSIRTANMERVPVAEGIAGLALEACDGDGLASWTVIAARVPVDALCVDRPSPLVTYPERGRSWYGAAQLAFLITEGTKGVAGFTRRSEIAAITRCCSTRCFPCRSQCARVAGGARLTLSAGIADGRTSAALVTVDLLTCTSRKNGKHREAHQGRRRVRPLAAAVCTSASLLRDCTLPLEVALP